MKQTLTRRQIIQLIGAVGVTALFSPNKLFASVTPKITKNIPSSGEQLPVIGMGTWRSFNVGSDTALLDMRTRIVKAFFEHGGGLIDSSPMYGSAPDVMGYALNKLGKQGNLFSAEKVWSPAGGSAITQFSDLSERWGVNAFDLFQIHNLQDWREHLAALKDMKAAGKIRYIGITTSHGRRHNEFESILASEDIDFAQLTYNVIYRDVERRLLPAAQDNGVAVIANRPFDGGSLIKSLKRKKTIPEWAVKEFNCRTWSDFLLKFIVSHPALTCAIPATTKVTHLHENMGAGQGELPSAKTRKKMIDFIANA